MMQMAISRASLTPFDAMDVRTFDKVRDHMEREIKEQAKQAKEAQLINSIQSFYKRR